MEGNIDLGFTLIINQFIELIKLEHHKAVIEFCRFINIWIWISSFQMRLDSTLIARSLFQEHFASVPNVVLVDVSDSPAVGAFQ